MDIDCVSAHCILASCVDGPSAGFQVSDAAGPAPHSIILSSSGSPGDAAIVTVEYRFGDGGGFGASAAHTYLAEGTFTVTQRVIDANGLIETATEQVVVTSGFVPVLFSNTDRSPSPIVELSGDRLSMEIVDAELAFAGARADRAITPGSGMFYFEGERLTDELGDVYFGVTTSAFPFNGQPGSNNQSFGINSGGSVHFGGAVLGTFVGDGSIHYGFVVDYRGASPIVHLALHDQGPGGGALVDRVDFSTPMPAVTGPLFIFVGGRRREVGLQARINTGNDTTNFPFNYDVAQLLDAANINPAGLVLGWGQTRARPANAAPSVNVNPVSTVALGASITLNATASDAEDGNLSAAIRWADLATVYATRDTNVGSSWTLTPRAIGIHPIEVSVTDSIGQTARVVVDVRVTGTLPQFDPVRLVEDDLSGSGIVLSTNGLSARWTENAKYGVRANQGMIGEFRYFEMHRLIGIDNQGGGLVIAEGNLDPYDPIDIPPSCSVNHSASVWRNLISEANYDTAETEYYGFAVDYRGRHPIVYVFTRESGQTVLAHDLTLDDVTVPIYPMLYGNPSVSNEPFDAEINFGALPFQYDPAAVLISNGVNPSGLELGWGDAN